MRALDFLMLFILLPSICFAATTASEFLSSQHLPLLVKVSSDSDFRIKLLRDGTVESENKSNPHVTGKWNVTDSLLLISFSSGSSGKKKLQYQMKLNENPKLAAQYELLIENNPITFTQNEEQILDINLPKVSPLITNKCLGILKRMAEAVLSKDQAMAVTGDPNSGKFKLENNGSIKSVYVKNGVNVEASISLISGKGWDCLYNSRFIVNLKNKTCGIVHFTLNHCAR